MQFQVIKIGPDIRKIFSLTNKSVKSIYIDKSGIFWLGTYQGGINKYDRNLPLFNLKRSNALDPRGLASPLVTSLPNIKPIRFLLVQMAAVLIYLIKKQFVHPLWPGKPAGASIRACFETGYTG
jgi:hypothetical protein